MSHSANTIHHFHLYTFVHTHEPTEILYGRRVSCFICVNSLVELKLLYCLVFYKMWVNGFLHLPFVSPSQGGALRLGVWLYDLLCDDRIAYNNSIWLAKVSLMDIIIRSDIWLSQTDSSDKRLSSLYTSTENHSPSSSCGVFFGNRITKSFSLACYA